MLQKPNRIILSLVCGNGKGNSMFLQTGKRFQHSVVNFGLEQIPRTVQLAKTSCPPISLSLVKPKRLGERFLYRRPHEGAKFRFAKRCCAFALNDRLRRAQHPFTSVQQCTIQIEQCRFVIQSIAPSYNDSVTNFTGAVRGTRLSEAMVSALISSAFFLLKGYSIFGLT